MVNTDMEVPSVGEILVMICFASSFVIFCIFSFITQHPSSPKFLLYELFRQSSLVYFLVQLFGIAYYAKLSFLPSNPAYIVPTIISIVAYVMTIFMGYAQTSSCDKPKRTIVLIQSIKPAICVVIAYFLVSKVSIIRQGFYDIVSKGKHSELGIWTAMAFWMSSSLWPSVSTAYFSIQQHSCNNDTEINIRNVPDKQPATRVI